MTPDPKTLVERLEAEAGLTVESPAPHLTGDMKFYVYDAEHRALLREAAQSLAARDGEPMFGAMLEADFEKGAVTFEMRGDYVCAAGLYEIRPHNPPAQPQQEARDG